MEQMRVIKEMRNADIQRGRTDDAVRCRWLCWENVPGALSSNSGEDFRCVLEEIARVIEEDADIPGPPKGGWPYAGSILVGRGSIAWKVHDAQYFGVPQRRKRICVLADFNGWNAPDVLFAPEYRGAPERGESHVAFSSSTGTGAGRSEVQPVGSGLPRDSQSSEQEREETSRDTSEGAGSTGKRELDEWCAAVNASAKHQQDLIQHSGGVSRALAPGTHASGSHLTKTLITSYGIDQQGGKGGANYTTDVAPTLAGDSHGTPHGVAYGIDSYNQQCLTEKINPLRSAQGGDEKAMTLCVR